MLVNSVASIKSSWNLTYFWVKDFDDSHLAPFKFSIISMTVAKLLGFDDIIKCKNEFLIGSLKWFKCSMNF